MSNSGLYITWSQLLYASILIISFYIAELVFFWLKHGRKNKTSGDPVLQKQIEALRQELDLTKVRVAALAAQLKLTQFEHDDLQLQSPSIVMATLDETSQDESPYAHAIRLAQQGADAQKVAAACGISRGEADLIVAIYRSAARS